MSLPYTIPIQSQGLISSEATIYKPSNSGYSAIIRNIKIKGIVSDTLFTLSIYRDKLKTIHPLYSFNLAQGDVLIDTDKYLIMPGDYLFATSATSQVSYTIDGYESLVDNINGVLQNL